MSMAPGTYVQEITSPTFNAVNTQSQSAFVFIGAHPQGPLFPTQVRSWAQFQALYGGFSETVYPSDLALAVYSFFNNGGGSCYVLRVVNAATAVAAATDLDNAAATPAPTLTVTAANPGTWGNDIYLVVTNNTTLDTFNLAVYVGGTAQANLAEPVWTNLSMNPANSRYAPSIVNNPLNGSSFIQLTDLATDPITAPGLPPASGSFQLGVGTSPVVGSNGSTVASTDLTAAQPELNALGFPLVINLPGVTDATNALASYATYCQTGRSFADSVLVVDPPQGESVAAEQSFAASLPVSSYVFHYYPWVTVSDPASATPGALRTIAPGAFAMAKMSTMDASAGVWTAPAGYSANLNAVSPERILQPSDVASLTALNVNTILYMPGAGIVVWGARTMSQQQNLRYINVRRLLIYIEYQLKLQSQYAAFADNNFFLWNQLTQRLGKFLNQVYASGAFGGTTAATSYFLVCDSTNNSDSSSTVNISAGIAPSEPAEFIMISVGQWQGGSSVTESSSTGTGG